MSNEFPKDANKPFQVSQFMTQSIERIVATADPPHGSEDMPQAGRYATSHSLMLEILIYFLLLALVAHFSCPF
jgi:hypothetical protein